VAYSYITVTQAVTQLSARLYDAGNSQWTSAELQAYLTESLRTFNALSGFWRDDMTFNLSLNTWWYDLRTVSGTLIPYTVTKYDLLTMAMYHLLEPATPSAWTGSLQFNLAQLNTAFQRRQDDLLGTSGSTLTQFTTTAALTRRTTLSDAVVDIRRIAWIPASVYSNKIMRQSDRWAQRAFDNSWLSASAAPPSTWLQNTEPPPSFDVDTVPPVVGSYDMLIVNSGSTWTAGSDSTVGCIQDDWCWVLKWGAMFDLLSTEPNAKDVARAAYCKARYIEGLALMQMMPITLALQIGTKPVAVDSVRNGDDYDAGWQALAAGTPARAYEAANILAVSPKPDGTYTAVASVVRNAPISSNVQIAMD